MTRAAKFVLLVVKPERRAELLAILNEVRRTTRAESGTQQWLLHDVLGRPDSVAMYEIYDDHAADVVHTNTNAPLVGLLPRLNDFLAEPAMVVDLEIVSTREDD